MTSFSPLIRIPGKTQQLVVTVCSCFEDYSYLHMRDGGILFIPTSIMPEASTSEKESQEVHSLEKSKKLPLVSPTAFASKGHSSPFPLETCSKLPSKKSESKLD